MESEKQILEPRKVDRNSKLPLYQQLYEILREKITTNEWKPGDLIPAETELIKIYQVSRITVRQVLDMFVKEGLVHRQRGRGTFVSLPAIESNLVRITSFTEDMRQRGAIPGTIVLEAYIVPATEELAEKLKIQAGDELICLQRLRLADGEPMSLEESYLIHKYCPGVLERHDYANSPLRVALENDHGIRLVRAQQTIRAMLPDRKLANILKVPLKSAVLQIERISFSQRNVPVEFLRVFYRADRYVLYNELQG